MRNGFFATATLGLMHHFAPDDGAGAHLVLREAAIATVDWAGALVSVPVWVLCAVSALILTALGAAVFIASTRLRKREAVSAPLTTAQLFGVKWRWNYHEGDIRDITSYCPKCDREVQPRQETRHGFLHLISYHCACGKWRSKSFQCSPVDMVDRVHHTIQKQART